VIHTAADLGRAKLAQLAARASELNMPADVHAAILHDRNAGTFGVRTVIFALWEQMIARSEFERAAREFERNLEAMRDDWWLDTSQNLGELT
jgi:hypothetical protein